MKQILITILAIFLLVAPSASAGSSPVVSSVQDVKSKNVVTVTFKVNIHCENCVKKLNDNIAFLKGVEDLSISLDKKTIVIKYDTEKTDEATLVKAIKKCGYSAEKVSSN